jgi:hypothetical protein
MVRPIAFVKRQSKFPIYNGGIEMTMSTQEERDTATVFLFAQAMKRKLEEARACGHSGWDDKSDCSQAFLSKKLRRNVEKGDAVDVANFAMFLWARGEAILPLQTALPPLIEKPLLADRTAIRQKGPELVTDRDDPRLSRTIDEEKVPQREAYLVLSVEERSKGYVRPVRLEYLHSDPELGCGAETSMSLALAQTYARDPKFYGATYCVGCSKHRPVGEFRWADDGTVVGS